jgi:hypothetical protein
MDNGLLNKHGGPRINSGRKPKGKDGPRKVVQVCLSPDNAAFLAAKGREKNDFINTHDPSPETQIQIERINQLNNILLILFFIVTYVD